MSKLKVLICSEASFISSGFGTYTRETLSRIYASNKYHIAEFASYAMVNDSRDKDIPWRMYANAVASEDPRHAEYNSSVENQFGRWRFDKVLLDFKPDVVIDIRDYWMSAYQSVSPFRKFFHWILMPTVDSCPQQEDWIDTFISADAIFTYSDWGAQVLKQQSGGKINYIATASPGVDLQTFSPHNDKIAIKKAFGVPSDSFIVGSVMRNQKRKLIPELMTAFRSLLDILEKENPALAAKTYLYLHTSYPDAGWDIPELLKQSRLANKVLFTYNCGSCGAVESCTFAHPAKKCRGCLTHGSMKLPTVTQGISSVTLSQIYNMFDVYVQYSICEGFGMPQVEAGACGIPIMTVNYSAMCDVIDKLEAYKIEVQSTFRELETKALRVYPSNNSLVQHILNFLSLPESMREHKKYQTRLLTEKFYNWDNVADKWMAYLDKLDASNYRSDWGAPVVAMTPLGDIPLLVANTPRKSQLPELLYLCHTHLKDHSLASYMGMLSMCRDADYGFSQSGASLQLVGLSEVLRRLQDKILVYNNAHEARMRGITFQEDFITYAHQKENVRL